MNALYASLPLYPSLARKGDQKGLDIDTLGRVPVSKRYVAPIRVVHVSAPSIDGQTAVLVDAALRLHNNGFHIKFVSAMPDRAPPKSFMDKLLSAGIEYQVAPISLSSKLWHTLDGGTYQDKLESFTMRLSTAPSFHDLRNEERTPFRRCTRLWQGQTS